MSAESPGGESHDIRPLVRHLGKPPEVWQRRDLVRFCLESGVRVVNFRYPSFDGKLRELRLPVSGRDSLEQILAAGERVDGSSLFPGLFDPARSDLYAVPVYRWAFLNPFSPDEVELVCRFADAEGESCPLTPDTLLATAAERLRKRTGLELKALAELEFYLILERRDDRFSGKAQRNYHQSAPYLHGRAIADEVLRQVSAASGRVKYCHSEVGYIDRLQSDDPELDGRRVEQYELEFDLMPIEDLGSWLTVARWMIRVIADQHESSVTFAPKLDEGMAGSGLHLHLALERDGSNVMLGAGGELSPEALGLIGGILGQAAPLTAFGNTVASSYLRLVPDQEAPTRICWGRQNRAGLLRIPLDFITRRRMDRVMNPAESGDYPESVGRPTVEYRSPDGSAFPHLLLAAVALAVEEGVLNPAGADLARELEIAGERVSRRELRDFAQLPQTAVASARCLREGRGFFEQRGFPARMIDLVVARLEAEADEGLSSRLRSLPAAERLRESRRLMHKDLHKH